MDGSSLVASFEGPSYRWALEETAEGILVMRPEGTASKEGVAALLEQLRQREQDRGEKARLLTISTRLEGMQPDARKLASSMFEPGSPVARFATCGDPFIMRAFFRLYAVVASIEMAAFETEADAMTWLRK